MKKSEIEKCIARYGKDVYSFCCYLTANRTEADDLYQDTFVKAMERGITLDRNPKSFLLSIACKLWKNKRRKDLNAGRLFCREDVSCINENDFQMRHENSAEAIAMQNDTNARIQNAVRKLPEKLKITALLYYMEERSVEQISDILHIPKGTVKSRLFQARKRLYKELEEVL